ncbi:MAG: hypothetical protein K2Y35_16565 [Burkholderiales bacterium]|nr:hypothetical protein [Burkholderiales bacterium]
MTARPITRAQRSISPLRAALAWTEALTLIRKTHAPDEDLERLATHITDREIVDLTVAIGAVNAWNRFSIAFRKMSLPT